jgi:hypothetical protein
MNELKYNLIEDRLKYLDIPVHPGILVSDISGLLKHTPRDILRIDITPIFGKREILVKLFYLLCNMLKGIDTKDKLIALEILPKVIEQ